jgi:hypothetical protein
MERGRGKRRKEDAHHFNEIIIGMHWWVDVEDSVGKDTLEHRLDAPLDLLPIKPPCHKHGPLEGRARHHFV